MVLLFFKETDTAELGAVCCGEDPMQKESYFISPSQQREINRNIRGMQAMIHFENLAQERHMETAHRSKLRQIGHGGRESGWQCSRGHIDFQQRFSHR